MALLDEYLKPVASWSIRERQWPPLIPVATAPLIVKAYQAWFQVTFKQAVLSPLVLCVFSAVCILSAILHWKIRRTPSKGAAPVDNRGRFWSCVLLVFSGVSLSTWSLVTMNRLPGDVIVVGVCKLRSVGPTEKQAEIVQHEVVNALRAVENEAQLRIVRLDDLIDEPTHTEERRSARSKALENGCHILIWGEVSGIDTSDTSVKIHAALPPEQRHTRLGSEPEVISLPSAVPEIVRTIVGIHLYASEKYEDAIRVLAEIDQPASLYYLGKSHSNLACLGADNPKSRLDKALAAFSVVARQAVVDPVLGEDLRWSASLRELETEMLLARISGATPSAPDIGSMENRLDKLRQEVDESKDLLRLALVEATAAATFELVADLDKAYDLYESSYFGFEEHGSAPEEVRALLSMQRVRQEQIRQLVSPDAKAELLADAESAGREALRVAQRYRLGRLAALASTSLADTLMYKAETEVTFDKSRETLEEAIRLDHAALPALKSESMLPRYLAARIGAANRLSVLGTIAPANEKMQYYDRAIATYERTLAELEHGSANWATIQYNLGIALGNAGQDIQGWEGVEFLVQAVLAYRGAITFRTRDSDPVSWAKCKSNLAGVYEDLALRGPSPLSRIAFQTALETAAEALEVRSSGVPRAITRGNEALALAGLASLSSDRDHEYLEQAVATLEESVETLRGQRTPRTLAALLRPLADARFELASHSLGEERREGLREVVAVYRELYGLLACETEGPDALTALAWSNIALGLLGEDTVSNEALRLALDAYEDQVDCP